jgi:hypothetical protein
MALLGVTVFITPAGVDRLSFQAIVPQQRLVTLRKRLPLFARRDSGGEPVGAVNSGHAAQFPQRLLQAVAKAFQALGKADRSRLPIGIRQHKVKDQMRKRHSRDGDLETRTMGEVGGG